MQIPAKTTFQNAFTIKTWEKLRPRGAKPLNLTTLTHFHLFFKRPAAPKKKSKSLPQWNSWAPKLTKKRKQKHSQKKYFARPQKVGPWPPWGGSANALFSIKSQSHPRKRPHRPRGLQNHRSGLKSKRQDLKNDEKLYSKMLARALTTIAHSSLRQSKPSWYNLADWLDTALPLHILCCFSCSLALPITQQRGAIIV